MNKAQEHKLTIKASNIEAHLGVLKQEIDKENTTLNRVVSERKLVEAQIKRANREVVLAEKACAGAQATKMAELSVIKTAKEQLVKQEDKLSADKARLAKEKVDFADAKKWELITLEDEKDIIRDSMNEMTEYINTTQVAFATEEKDYERQILSLESETSSKTDERDTVMADLEAAQTTLSEAQNDILSSSKEKEVLSIEIEKLLESKATVFKNLEDREKAVSDTERGLGVMTRRLEKRYKKDYPDVKFKL